MDKIIWKNVKDKLSSENNSDLLGIIKDLYSLNAENKEFLHAKCQLIDPFEHYRCIIENTVCPEIGMPLKLSTGRKAISRYKKATGNAKGELELMVFYVECGNQFTLLFGDINEQFYNSVISMFSKVLEKLPSFNDEFTKEYIHRLYKVVKDSDGIGWGYHDDLNDLFYNAFPEFDNKQI